MVVLAEHGTCMSVNAPVLMVYGVSVIQCPVTIVSLISIDECVCARARAHDAPSPVFSLRRPFGRSMIKPHSRIRGQRGAKRAPNSQDVSQQRTGGLTHSRAPVIVEKPDNPPHSCHQTVNISIDSVVLFVEPCVRNVTSIRYRLASGANLP